MKIRTSREKINGLLEQAKTNRVLALFLLNRSHEAFRLAEQYIASGLKNATMVCRLIDSAPNIDALDEYSYLIDQFASSNSEVNTSLFYKLHSFGEHLRAEAAAKRAISLSPASPHTLFCSAMATHNEALHGDWSLRQSRIKEAMEKYDSAILLAAEDNWRNLLPDLYMNRGTLNALSGNLNDALADFKKSVESAKTPSAYSLHAVRFLLHCQKPQLAKDFLPSLDCTSLDGKLCFSLVNSQLTPVESEQASYIKTLQELAETPWDRSVECRIYCISLALSVGDFAKATDCITDSFLIEHPFQAEIAQAWIAFESGNERKAREHADLALTKDSRRAHHEELRLLSQILISLRLYSSAIDILLNIITPGVLNDEMKSLLECAQFEGRHDILLRLRRELRTTGE